MFLNRVAGRHENTLALPDRPRVDMSVRRSADRYSLAMDRFDLTSTCGERGWPFDYGFRTFGHTLDRFRLKGNGSEFRHGEIVDSSKQTPMRPIPLVPVGSPLLESAMTPEQLSRRFTHGKGDAIRIDHAEVPDPLGITGTMGHSKFGFGLCPAFNSEPTFHA